jgi:hypothetical protein
VVSQQIDPSAIARIFDSKSYRTSDRGFDRFYSFNTIYFEVFLFDVALFSHTNPCSSESASKTLQNSKMSDDVAAVSISSRCYSPTGAVTNLVARN